jgi:hypothetical protein
MVLSSRPLLLPPTHRSGLPSSIYTPPTSLLSPHGRAFRHRYTRHNQGTVRHNTHSHTAPNYLFTISQSSLSVRLPSSGPPVFHSLQKVSTNRGSNGSRGKHIRYIHDEFRFYAFLSSWFIFQDHTGYGHDTSERKSIFCWLVESIPFPSSLKREHHPVCLY